MSEFDRHAPRYKAVLDRSVQISGEDSEYFADYKALYIARLVGEGFSGKILDFGCGVGLVSRSLKRYLPAASMHGYDESPTSIGLVDADVCSQGLYTTDNTALGTDYDLVVVANVLHHVPPGRRQALCDELYARLVPGGDLFVFEHNPYNPLTRWVVNHCPLDEGAILLRPTETIGYMGRAGFHSVTSNYVVFFPRPLGWARGLESWLGWCPLGAQYVIQAKRTRE